MCNFTIVTRFPIFDKFAVFTNFTVACFFVVSLFSPFSTSPNVHMWYTCGIPVSDRLHFASHCTWGTEREGVQTSAYRGGGLLHQCTAHAAAHYPYI